jgi:acetoin utilization protein AcuC
MVQFGLGSDDCPAFPGDFDQARLSAGATLAGARSLAEGQAHFAFNPIGGFHHAGPAHAEGFCYFNDVVLACQELADRGLRVACLDLDVHHGNGTEDAFLADGRVLTLSVHESGKTLYPWRGEETVVGEGEGRGFNVNVPLLEGTDDIGFQRAWGEIVLPVLKAFAPEVVVLEIGMDVLLGDPLAHLKLTNNGVADVMPSIRELQRPVLVLGGGGYHPQNTARGWALAWSVLCDSEPVDDYAGVVGGVFLGDAERAGALRDMRVYASGEDREKIDGEVDRLISYHRQHTFPAHGIG